MEVYTKIPKNKIDVRNVKKKASILQIKKNSLCMVVRTDTNQYLDANGMWSDDVNKANITTFEEAYNNTVDFPITFKLEYLLLKY